MTNTAGFSCQRLLLGLLVAVAAPIATARSENLSVQDDGVNLAVVAKPSTSFVSGHETLNAINDGMDPRHSNDTRHGEYGNWPRKGTQWLQYEWSQPIFTRKIDVYWWNDRRGVRIPTGCRLLYWQDNAFVPVENPSGLGLLENQYNTTSFDEVTTAKLRLEIDGDGDYSTGVIEWKVYDSGKSPAFPPIVAAGGDRSVILGGRTYLSGKIQTLSTKQEPASVTWGKVSGPGTVSFVDAGLPITTATFSEAGDYVLKLTAGSGSLNASSTLNVQVVPRPPVEHLELIDTRSYSIDSPLWNNRAQALIVHWIPHCIRKISDPELKEGGINNFIEAANALAGKPHGDHRGYVFSNAWVYNTIESICVALMIDPQGDQDIIAAQQSMKQTLEDWIPKILAAQEPDGYLQTVFTLSDRQHWSPRHRGDHEGYVAGYFLEAAVAHYLLTSGADDRLYNAAKRLADCWDNNIGPPPKKPWYDGHQAMEIALVRFGRFVNKIEGKGSGDKYIALAKFLLDCRRDGSEYDQSHVPVVQQYEAVGHAVRASYSYAGMADVAMETGDIDYQSAVMSLWDNIVNKKYYVTGGIGSGETSEGFGPDYSLRQNAYCESCSSCGEIFFQHKLNLIYHDASFADLYEETLYNALLGSIDLAGENFYYQNPLDEGRDRYDWHGCPCCVGNIPRTLLSLPTWMYAKDDDSIYVNLFVGSTFKINNVAGTDIEMVQVTNYPWSGDVNITVNPAKAVEMSVKIRIPNHSVSTLYSSQPEISGISRISVNGEAVVASADKGYAVITRTWKPGDNITLTLPMKVQRIKGNDKIEATRGRVALRYGPLIYCVENVNRDSDNVLAPETDLQAVFQQDLFGGVIVIRGNWADGSPMEAIPYYARHNRSSSDESRAADSSGRRGSTLSRVWLKDE